jgi:hypothetical protein
MIRHGETVKTQGLSLLSEVNQFFRPHIGAGSRQMKSKIHRRLSNLYCIAIQKLKPTCLL